MLQSDRTLDEVLAGSSISFVQPDTWLSYTEAMISNVRIHLTSNSPMHNNISIGNMMESGDPTWSAEISECYVDELVHQAETSKRLILTRERRHGFWII